MRLDFCYATWFGNREGNDIRINTSIYSSNEGWPITEKRPNGSRNTQRNLMQNIEREEEIRSRAGSRDAPRNPRIAASSSDELSTSTRRPRIIFTFACTPPWRIVSRCDVSKNKFRWCTAMACRYIGITQYIRHYIVTGKWRAEEKELVLQSSHKKLTRNWLIIIDYSSHI